MALVDELRLPDPRVMDPNFLVLVESCLEYLRKLPGTQMITVPAQTAAKYAGDFSGLLDTQAIDKKFHYLVMRTNNLRSSCDYDGLVQNLIIPDLTVASQIMTTWSSRLST